MISALLLAFSANAANHEVNLELGWIGARDPAWDTFSNANSHGTFGARVGYRVHPRIAVIAGWHHGSDGLSVEGDYEDEDGDGTADNGIQAGGYRTAFYGDQVTLGAKADLAVRPWFHPYVAVQGAVMRALVRMDDDAEDDENLTQVQAVGLTGGGVATAGMDFPIPLTPKLSLALYAEFGYALLAPAQFDQLGSIQFGGFSGRTGMGLRF